jgi:hypothetical protein
MALMHALRTGFGLYFSLFSCSFSFDVVLLPVLLVLVRYRFIDLFLSALCSSIGSRAPPRVASLGQCHWWLLDGRAYSTSNYTQSSILRNANLRNH